METTQLNNINNITTNNNNDDSSSDTDSDTKAQTGMYSEYQTPLKKEIINHISPVADSLSNTLSNTIHTFFKEFLTSPEVKSMQQLLANRYTPPSPIPFNLPSVSSNINTINHPPDQPPPCRSNRLNPK